MEYASNPYDASSGVKPEGNLSNAITLNKNPKRRIDNKNSLFILLIISVFN